MPLYKTVCRNPSAALSEIRSSACPLPDCILAFLACTFSSSFLTPGKIASIHSGGTVSCKESLHSKAVVVCKTCCLLYEHNNPRIMILLRSNIIVYVTFSLLHAGHCLAILLTRALPRKCLFMKPDCSQPLAIAKACSAARGFFSTYAWPSEPFAQ